MNPGKFFRVFVLIVSLMFGNVILATDDKAKQTELTTQEKVFILSLFWKEVSYNFAHWKSAGELDWDKTYREYIPQILATTNDFEFYRVMQKFCALLKDGHTNIWMPKGLLKQHLDRIPLVLREFNKRAIVHNLDINLAEQIPVGSEILEVDGKTIKDMVKEDIIPYISTSSPHIYWETAIRSFRSVGAGILFGPKGSVANLKIQKPDGEIFSIKIARNQYEGKVNWAEKFSKNPLSEFKMLESDIAYMALNSFSNNDIVDEFRAKLPELAKAKGIIIDLRENGGGSSLNSSDIVGHFTDKPFLGASWHTTIHDGVYKAWGKAAARYKNLEEYKDYYYGHVYRHVEANPHQPSEGIKLSAPTIVLISRKTASAAEDFLIMADDIEHISSMGEPTYGSTGQPLAIDFPGGGTARVSAKRDFYPDGREFIGLGIQPDIKVLKTVDDFRSGNDLILNKAVETLKKNIIK